MSERDKVVRGSGDFLKDMGYADPDGMRVKFALANKITLAIEDRCLSPEKAAAITGFSLQNLRRIENGWVDPIDVELLQAALTALEESDHA